MIRREQFKTVHYQKSAPLDLSALPKHHPLDPRERTLGGRVGTEIAPRPPHRSGRASFSHPAPPEIHHVATVGLSLIARAMVGIGNGWAFRNRLNGAVTLAFEERGGLCRHRCSSRRGGLAPRRRRRGAQHTVRLSGGQMALDVERVVDGCVG